MAVRFDINSYLTARRKISSASFSRIFINAPTPPFLLRWATILGISSLAPISANESGIPIDFRKFSHLAYR